MNQILNVLTEMKKTSLPSVTMKRSFHVSCSHHDHGMIKNNNEFLSCQTTFCSVNQSLDGGCGTFDFFSSLSYDLYNNIYVKCFSVQDGWNETDVDGLFHDVVFVVEGKRVPAHRVIVCARSAYFRALFLNGMKEMKPDVVDIEDCEYEVFKSIICWMYTDQLKVPEGDNVEQIENSVVWKLWRAATYFCLDGMVKLIENYIMKNIINCNNICSFWDTVAQINAFSLQNFCSLYFQEHLNEIVATKNFVSLSKEMISRLFSDQLGKCPIPVQVKAFALTRWFAANNPKHLKRKLESMDNFYQNPLKKRKLNREKI